MRPPRERLGRRLDVFCVCNRIFVTTAAFSTPTQMFGKMEGGGRHKKPKLMKSKAQSRERVKNSSLWSRLKRGGTKTDDDAHDKKHSSCAAETITALP